MVIFGVERQRGLARLGRITQWGLSKTKALDNETPSFMVYTRSGHVPDLTWDTFDKWIKLSQNSIFQISISTCVELLKHIEAYKKPVTTFSGMPSNALTHLTFLDPLGKRQSGYNTNNAATIFTKGGNSNIDPLKFRHVVQLSQCDSVCPPFDYDTPKDSANKRIKKSVARTVEYAERVFERLPNLGVASILVLVGGSSVFHRKEVANQLGSKEYAVGFSIDLLEYSCNPKIEPNYPFEDEEIKGLLKEQLELIPKDKIRIVEGAFNPSNIFHLIRLGVDLFDNSYAVQLADESKAFQITSLYPKDLRFSTCDLTEDRFADDFTPLFSDCSCYTCTHYTKAYLNHLHKTHEMLIGTLLVIHNMNEFDRMFVQIREFLKNESA